MASHSGRRDVSHHQHVHIVIIKRTKRATMQQRSEATHATTRRVHERERERARRLLRSYTGRHLALGRTSNTKVSGLYLVLDMRLHGYCGVAFGSFM
jgi:hypothetical protein